MSLYTQKSIHSVFFLSGVEKDKARAVAREETIQAVKAGWEMERTGW